MIANVKEINNNNNNNNNKSGTELHFVLKLGNVGNVLRLIFGVPKS